MNEYQVSDYGILSDAVTTTKNYMTKVGEAQAAVTECKTSLGAGVFEGPIADNCQQELATLDADVQSIVSKFEAISGLIITNSENYQGADKNTSTGIIDSTNKDTTTTSANITNKRMSIPSDPTVAAKKQEWLGDVDDASRYTEYTGNNLFGRHNTLELFDNTTGEVIQDHGKITMKPGETRVITVKLPTDTGMINQITRTTADGDSGYRSGKVISAKSDIDPDPNNIEYVRLAEGGNGSYHEPSNMSLLHNNSYDWIITANAKGQVTASQTCLWSSSMTNGRNLKGMINLNVEVTDEDKDNNS